MARQRLLLMIGVAAISSGLLLFSYYHGELFPSARGLQVRTNFHQPVRTSEVRINLPTHPTIDSLTSGNTSKYVYYFNRDTIKEQKREGAKREVGKREGENREGGKKVNDGSGRVTKGKPASAVFVRPIQNEDDKDVDHRSTVPTQGFGSNNSITGFSSTESSDRPKSIKQSPVVADRSIGVIRQATSEAEKEAHNNYVSKRFAARNEKIRELCKISNYLNATLDDNLYNLNGSIGYGRLGWCRIPKVGTTFLTYLKKTVIETDSSLKGKKSKGGRSKNKKSFFFVREPYSRLVSGYICKIVLTAQWWVQLGSIIVNNFRKKSNNNKKVYCGHDVTFPEFIKYFIYSQNHNWARNMHFVPIHEQCHICERHYDYVGHLETFREDLNFMLRSVNVSGDFDMSSEERELKGKSKGVFKHKKVRKRCEPTCTTLRKAWWSFHVRGLISKDIDFPSKEIDCDTISDEEFANITWAAHLRSVGVMDKAKQKREAIVQLYLQLALSDRLKLMEIFKQDFQLFGYDPQPTDIFPELAGKPRVDPND